MVTGICQNVKTVWGALGNGEVFGSVNVMSLALPHIADMMTSL